MAFECEFDVLGAHPAPVVGDADEGDAAFFDLEGDTARPCVDGVVEQLTDDGYGALYDLAGRNPGGNLRGKDADRAPGAGLPGGAHRVGLPSRPRTAARSS